MGYVSALQKTLFSEFEKGVNDARREFLKEDAAAIERVTGIKGNYHGASKPTEMRYLRPGVLGETALEKDGSVKYIAVNTEIPRMVECAMKRNGQSENWAKYRVYDMAKMVTKHEHTHALTSPMVRGEKWGPMTTDIMESLTTYGLKKALEENGKYYEAGVVANNNPYPKAWLLGKAADWAPYKGKTGDYFKGFVQDAYNEKFYRPMARLASSVGKTVARKGRTVWKKLVEGIPGKKLAMRYNGLDGHDHHTVSQYRRYEKGVREIPQEKSAAGFRSSQ